MGNLYLAEELAEMRDRTQPVDLIIAGVPKAGTTTLFQSLIQHTEICGSAVKETCYFLPIRYGHEIQPIEEYWKFFQGCPDEPDIIRLESTPGYFYGGLKLCEAINKACPKSNILLVLREPVSRFVSFFRYKQSILEIKPEMSIEEYYAKCSSATNEDLNRQENDWLMGLEGGLYVKYLSPWIETFANRLRIVTFDDITQHPQITSKAITRWLGVRDASPLIVGHHNKTLRFKSARIHQLALGVYRLLEPFLRRYPLIKNNIVQIYDAVNRKPYTGSVNKEIIRELEEKYSAQNRYLPDIIREHLLLDAPAWLSNR
jgi:hypothetical protein